MARDPLRKFPLSAIDIPSGVILNVYVTLFITASILTLALQLVSNREKKSHKKSQFRPPSTEQEVEIIDFSGKYHQVQVAPSTTGLQMKKILHKITGTPLTTQRLLCNGVEISDESTLATLASPFLRQMLTLSGGSEGDEKIILQVKDRHLESEVKYDQSFLPKKEADKLLAEILETNLAGTSL